MRDPEGPGSGDAPGHQALWEAKLRLCNAHDERGEPLYTVRDWAAWVLTGEPN